MHSPKIKITRSKIRRPTTSIHPWYFDNSIYIVCHAIPTYHGQWHTTFLLTILVVLALLIRYMKTFVASLAPWFSWTSLENYFFYSYSKSLLHFKICPYTFYKSVSHWKLLERLFKETKLRQTTKSIKCIETTLLSPTITFSSKVQSTKLKLGWKAIQVLFLF